jgi:hypothetical protein
MSRYCNIRLKSSVRDEGLSCCLILLIAYRLLCIYFCVSKLHSECVHYMLLKETHTPALYSTHTPTQTVVTFVLVA